METLAEKKVGKRIAEIPENYRKGYKKAVKGGSKRAAIKAFCLECSMWQEDEITGCKAVTCPLYSVRPFVKKDAALRNLRGHYSGCRKFEETPHLLNARSSFLRCDIEIASEMTI